MDQNCFNAARAYVASGFKVVPAEPDRGWKPGSKDALALKQPAKRLVPPDLDDEGDPIRGSGGYHKASADPAQIKAWWRESPKSGVIIPCAPNGLVVFDVDPRNGGNEGWADLCRRHPALLACEVVAETPSGGTHWYFRADPALILPGKAAQGVDIKHNGYVVAPPSLHWQGGHYQWRAGKSLLDNDLLLTPIPDALLEELQTSKVPADDGLASDEDDVFGDVEGRGPIGYTQEQIADLLDCIPNDSLEAPVKTRDDWLKIGMALHHETDGADWALDLWDEWTSRHPSYDGRKIVEGRWISFGKAVAAGRKLVTLRHVIALAKDARKEESEETVSEVLGRLVSAQDEKELETICKVARETAVTETLQRQRMVDALRTAWKRITGAALPTAKAEKLLRYENPEMREIPDWLSGTYYVANRGDFHGAKDGVSLGPREFDMLHGKHVLTREEILQGITEPPHRPSSLAMTRYQIPVVHALGYLPSRNYRVPGLEISVSDKRVYSFNGMRYLNRFTDRNIVKPKPADEAWTTEEKAAVAAWRFILEANIPDDRERGIVISAMRYILKHRARLNWAICVQGAENCGKSLLFSTFWRAVIGGENHRIVDANQLFGEFNAFAYGSLVSTVEEIRVPNHSRFEAMEKIKPLITNGVVSIRAMRENPVDQLNTTTYFLLTNHRDALAITGDDTRYFVIFSPLSTKSAVQAFNRKHPQAFERCVKAIFNHGAAIVRWILDQTPHPDFHPDKRAPESDSRNEMASAGRAERDEILDGVLEDNDPFGEVGLMPSLLSVQALRSAMAAVVEANGGIQPDPPIRDDRWLVRALQSRGFNYLGSVKLAAPGDRQTGQDTRRQVRLWSRVWRSWSDVPAPLRLVLGASKAADLSPAARNVLEGRQEPAEDDFADAMDA